MSVEQCAQEQHHMTEFLDVLCLKTKRRDPQHCMAPVQKVYFKIKHTGAKSCCGPLLFVFMLRFFIFAMFYVCTLHTSNDICNN